ncbi:hypothetical protein SLA2020_130220 [Shorea laevis]
MSMHLMGTLLFISERTIYFWGRFKVGRSKSKKFPCFDHFAAFLSKEVAEIWTLTKGVSPQDYAEDDEARANSDYPHNSEVKTEKRTFTLGKTKELSDRWRLIFMGIRKSNRLMAFRLLYS